MIRAIVALGQWLDARFPAKVVVLQKDYNNLHHKIDELHVVIVAMRQVIDKQVDHVEDIRVGFVGRLNAHEESIKAIKDAMTKAPTMAAQVRADYIRSGRMPE